MNQTEIQEILEDNDFLDEEVSIINILKAHFNRAHCAFLARLLTEEE